MKKRMLALTAALTLALAGCGPKQQDSKIEIVAAIFPEYDWVRQIVGEDDTVNVTLLIADGVDPHSFQPSVVDMVTVSESDLLIFGGGESDQWLGKLIAESKNEKQRVIQLLPLLGEDARQEEIVDGMQSESDGDELDEHVWLSLSNAARFCQAIADELCALNPGKAADYRANLDSYLTKLNALDAAYRQAVGAAGTDTIVVCDRFPFRYLVEDYGLNYYAAFPGCSAETGASFETVVFLANKVKALNLPALLVTESSDGRLAQTVAESAGRKDIPVLTLNSMQSVSGEEAARTGYLTVMEHNLAVLKQALG